MKRKVGCDRINTSKVDRPGVPNKKNVDGFSGSEIVITQHSGSHMHITLYDYGL